MDRPARSQTEQQPPPQGGYAVFHERPFPKRLDRVFRVGAVVVATPIFLGGVIAAGYALYASADIRGIGALAGLGVILSGMAYGFVRAVGMIVVGVYGGTRPKQYVVDWTDRPPG